MKVLESLKKPKSKIDTIDFVQNYKNKIHEYLIKRQFLQYGMKDFLKYILACLCFRNNEGFRNNDKFRKHFILSQGEKKLRHELDIITLLRSIR